MTNLQAIIGELKITGYSELAVEKALLDAGLNPTDTYNSSASNKIIAKAAIEVLEGMLAVEKVSEGGYSITYSREGVMLLIASLKKKHNIINGREIKALNVW